MYIHQTDKALMFFNLTHKIDRPLLNVTKLVNLHTIISFKKNKKLNF